VPELPTRTDQVLACAHLVGRAGARSFEIGYLDDDPTNPRWWATAQYQGTRLTADDHTTPEAAADALARRILDGAKCRCGRLVATSPFGARAYPSTLITGERWTPDMAQKAGQCLWRRNGPRWEPACNAPPVTLPEERR
jgi:hypothetical protein